VVNLDIWELWDPLSAIQDDTGDFEVVDERCRAIWEDRADALSNCGFRVLLMVGVFRELISGFELCRVRGRRVLLLLALAMAEAGADRRGVMQRFGEMIGALQRNRLRTVSMPADNHQ
jgi:hypothetical protein